MRRVAVRFVVSTALIVSVVAALAYASTVMQSADPVPDQLIAPKIEPSGPLITATNLMPGDHAKKDFTVENANGEGARLMLSGNMTAGDRDLYDVLFATVSSKQTGELWYGPLWELAQQRNTGFLTAHQKQDLTFDMVVPAWAGNQYQHLRTEYSLAFSFENDNPGADRVAPSSKILTRRPTKRIIKSQKRWLIRGTATDARSSIAEVKMTLIRIVKRNRKSKLPSRCTSWVPKRKKLVSIGGRKTCKSNWFSAVGKEKWNYYMPTKPLPAGTYILMSRAIDTAGNIESDFSAGRGNSATFKIRKK